MHIFQNPQFAFAIKSIGDDQVLTKIFQIDPELTFNVFHILNHGRISKIEKIFDSIEYPPPKKKGLENAKSLASLFPRFELFTGVILIVVFFGYSETSLRSLRSFQALLLWWLFQHLLLSLLTTYSSNLKQNAPLGNRELSDLDLPPFKIVQHDVSMT